nr:deazaflavin-dependent nitroreductase family protein [Mycolicibacterium malmesburyense]
MPKPTASGVVRRSMITLARIWTLGSIAYVIGAGLFERLAPRPWVHAYQRIANPAFRRIAGYAHGWAVIETTGRKTGRKRQTPVGGRLVADRTYWLVSGDWRYSSFVRNIEAGPRVRVKVHGRWRHGYATLLPTDPARRRLLMLNPFNSAFVAIAAKDPLTVRIDLSREHCSQMGL